MRLFTKDIDKKLFEQYKYANDLSKQKVVAKIFNPYSRGTWYLLNSDPNDPNYIWAIVDLIDIEIGSVSRSELESIKVPPFRLPLERDTSFTPINAMELYKGLKEGKHYKDGGVTNYKSDLQLVEDEKTKSYYLFPNPSDKGSMGIKFKDGGYMAKGGSISNFDPKKLVGRTFFGKNTYGKIIDVRVISEDNIKVKYEKSSGTLLVEKSFTKKELFDMNNGKQINGDEILKMSNGGYMSDGGEIQEYIVWVSKDGENREYYATVKSFKAAKIKSNKLWESGEYEKIGLMPKEKFTQYGIYYKDGGMTFSDKVDSVKSSLLKRRKVSPSVQKDYGKTYSPKEAEDSAKRIVGSQVAKYKRG